MELIFLEEKWYRTNWNYFLTPSGVFVLRSILTNDSYIYFDGFTYDDKNQTIDTIFKTDDEEMRRLIKSQIISENNMDVLRCTEHTRLILYNFFSNSRPIEDAIEKEHINNIIELILS